MNFELPCRHDDRWRTRAFLERGVWFRVHCQLCGRAWWMRYAYNLWQHRGTRAA